MKFKNLDGKIIANRINLIIVDEYDEIISKDYYVAFPFCEYKLESNFDVDLFEEHGEKEFGVMEINNGILTVYLDEY